jgi:hypothetical protein
MRVVTCLRIEWGAGTNRLRRRPVWFSRRAGRENHVPWTQDGWPKRPQNKSKL